MGVRSRITDREVVLIYLRVTNSTAGEVQGYVRMCRMQSESIIRVHDSRKYVLESGIGSGVPE
jgi:hypothetical protein